MDVNYNYVPIFYEGQFRSTVTASSSWGGGGGVGVLSIKVSTGMCGHYRYDQVYFSALPLYDKVCFSISNYIKSPSFNSSHYFNSPKNYTSELT